MKINPLQGNTVNPYTRSQQKVEQTDAAKAQKADKLEISSAAKEMQEKSRIVTERQERIEKLKVDIESGNYQVNSKQLAQDLLKHYRPTNEQ